MNNQYSFWYTGQVVTQANMADFSQDLYNRFAALSQAAAPCILFLDGSISEAGGVVTIPAGAFRFNDAAINGFTTGIFGMAETDTVNISPTDTGFIVASYTVVPPTIAQINYTINVTYNFVTALASTDCALAEITAGAISSLAVNYYINSAASNAQVSNAISDPSTSVNNVALTPFNLQTIYNGQNSDYNRSTSITTATYAPVQSDNFSFLLGNTVAVNYTLDSTSTSYLDGYTVCLYDYVSGATNITLITSGNNRTIIGQQLGGYYKIVCDGGYFFVTYITPYMQYSNVITEATLPIAATVAWDGQGVNDGTTNNVPTADIIGSNQILLSSNGVSVNLPVNRTFQLTYICSANIPNYSGSNQSILTATINQSGASVVGANVIGKLSTTTIVGLTDNSGVNGNMVAAMILTTGNSGANISIQLELQGGGATTATVDTNSSLQITEILTN